MDDEPINAHKLLKEQFVSNLTGSSLLEIAALSTVVPAVVVLRKWSCGDNTRKNSLKKNDDALPGHKGFVHYFSTLAIDYLSIVLPVLLIFTVLAEWACACALSLVMLISILTMFKRSRSHLKAGPNDLPLLRADISSYRVSVVLVTCLCILAVDFKIFPRRYAKAETYGCGIVHVGEYGVHWNFFFTLAAISILTSVIRIHPKYCGLAGLLVLTGFQTWLSFGLNEYLISNERNGGIISQNKEGYWGMYLIGVSLGYNLFFDNSSKGKSRSSQVVKVWVLAASFWIMAIILDSYVERVSRRMVISILTLAGFISYEKNLVLEDAFNQNMLGSFLLANILTGVVNLSVDTLSASSGTAFMIFKLSWNKANC
uniref:Uncharacterized protein n=1 Tax=Oryza nivara TaxID=4536 RepID=A0A0E0GMZ1_ORYNI